MSPELSEALNDNEIRSAFLRLYNFKKLRDLQAPPVIIQGASDLLDKSKSSLGVRYEIVLILFEEFEKAEDAHRKAQGEWQDRCRTCKNWDPNNNGDTDMWCRRYTYSNHSCPDPCPDYQKYENHSDVESGNN